MPEPASNKEEIEGKRMNQQIDFVFVPSCASTFQMLAFRGRHDDGFSADGICCSAHRGAERAGKVPVEARGQRHLLFRGAACCSLNVVFIKLGASFSLLRTST